MALYRKNYARVAIAAGFVVNWQQRLDETGCDVAILRPDSSAIEIIAEQFKGHFPFECEENRRILNAFTFALVSPRPAHGSACVFLIHDSRVAAHERAGLNSDEALFIMWSRSDRPTSEDRAFSQRLIGVFESGGGRRLRPWYERLFLCCHSIR